MYELFNWIDRDIHDVENTRDYKKYFEGIELENIEETYFVENLSMGIDTIYTENMKVNSIHLYSGRFLDGERFADKLPFDLSFDYNRAVIHKLLGIPDVVGGNLEGLLGFYNRWEKYFFDTYSLHFQYSKNESYIEMITIGSLDFEKKFGPE